MSFTPASHPFSTVSPAPPIAAKDVPIHRYTQSEALLQRAEQTIPLGSQTFSKSKTQFPYGVSPYFIQRAERATVWDVDGNEYLDFINALASVILGYNHPAVTQAVQAQLQEGTIFSLPHPIEMQVAEKLTQHIACAEMVRFGKNGSDATSGAIRVARAYTGKDHVAICGYHGWHDWYIGTTARNKGIPQAVSNLSHTFQYNNLDSLHQIFKAHPGDVAAVILEPMNTTLPEPGFLEAVKAMAHQHGALLVFDETITGFRYHLGGAQAYFGITPDLATFGKAMANGYPLSAIVGRADVMRTMEEIFYSFTFGGETLSLAAALATINTMETEPVIDTLFQHGSTIQAGVQQRIQQHALNEFLSFQGLPCWSFLVMQDTPQASSLELKTLFLQEMFQRGILTLGTHNLSYAHQAKDVDTLLNAYDAVFPLLKRASEGELKTLLQCAPLTPLFKVR